eukprot:6187999-Pleurochrysis_carterae.AAC.1
MAHRFAAANVCGQHSQVLTCFCDPRTLTTKSEKLASQLPDELLSRTGCLRRGHGEVPPLELQGGGIAPQHLLHAPTGESARAAERS